MKYLERKEYLKEGNSDFFALQDAVFDYYYHLTSNGTTNPFLATGRTIFDMISYLAKEEGISIQEAKSNFLRGFN